MKYIYGPLKSRRLGLSLGVSTVPYKVCSFDCVYCQLRQTTKKTVSRKLYVSNEEILDELRCFFLRKPPQVRVDYVTFSGSGEPTLNKGLGKLIDGARKITDVPVAVITNSSTLLSVSVRRDVAKADLVVPSLDAVTQDIFEKIDRPCKGIMVRDVIKALVDFRREFKGKIWLEIMLVRGLNDSPEYMERMKKVAMKIRPDRIQINTPVRVPALSWVRVPAKSTLKLAGKIFGKGCDVIC